MKLCITFDVKKTLYIIDTCRSRLRGMHYGTLEQQKGAMKHVGGSGETYMEVRRQLLKVIWCYLLRFAANSFSTVDTGV